MRKEPCKSVVTRDASGKENGFLVELYKDGKDTTLYLTATFPGGQKGYHLHTVRQSHLVCVRGKMKITLVEEKNKTEHLLDAQKPERLLVPTGVWILYENIGNEEGWMLNFPTPPYDPDLKGEQRELAPSDVEAMLARGEAVPRPDA